jgi:hypothetical protein
VIKRLTVAEIVGLARETPEQTVFDWKRTFEPPRDEDAKGEFVKDVMSIANGCAFTRSEGYVVYGINPEAPEPVVGIQARWDDNEAQKIVRSVLAPAPDFLYYEVDAGEVDARENRTVGVVGLSLRASRSTSRAGISEGSARGRALSGRARSRAGPATSWVRSRQWL